MGKKTSKKSIPEYEQDWFALPGKPTLSRINKIIGLTAQRQEERVERMKNEQVEDLSVPRMSKVLGYDNQDRTWKQIGYKCFDCGKLLREGRITEKHPQICKRTLKINKTEEDDILKLVRKNNAS